MSRGLIIVGLTLVAIGVLWPWLTRLGLGRLPGDILIERSQGSFYFPLTTCAVISVLTSLLWWWLKR